MGGLLIVELISFLAYYFPIIGPFGITAIGLAVLILAWKRPEAALSILLLELIVGSKGHMLSWQGEDSFSLRMAIWLAVLLAFCLRLVIRWPSEGKELLQKAKIFPFRNQYLLLSLSVLIGLIIGFWRNALPDFIADANAWVYFLILPPFVAAYYHSSVQAKQRLLQIMELGAIWLAIKTLAFLFLFSHNVIFLSDLYWWIRRSGVGEVTAMAGGWQRIFIQSQVFSAIMLLISLRDIVSRPLGRFQQILVSSIKPALYVSTIVLSMSRSFWLGLGVMGIGAGAFLLFKRAWPGFGRLVAGGAAALLLGAVLIFAVINFPYPSGGPLSFSARAFAQRTDLGDGEAAISSRWNLLGPLSKASFESPIFGQGFGRTVTYRTEDPRLVLSGRQDYTTYAFEWGYLDILLKLGILGFFAYLWLLFSILKRGLTSRDGVKIGLSLGIIFLALIHVFTPYLNHPLGIAYIVLASCLIADDTV